MQPKRKHHDDELDNPDASLVRRRDFARSSEMNVTPLIDVLLVLLVIFMATLPLAQHGLDIHLPIETQSQPAKSDTTQVVVALSAERQLTLNKQPIVIAEVEQRLRETFAGRSDKTVYVVASDSLAYGEVVPILDAATAVGLKIAIVTLDLQRAAQRPK